MYKDLEKYFNDCQNCGERCRVPGIFLPAQIEALAEHLDISSEELFRRYLIAELFTPNVNSAPVFVISPVMADSEGYRLSNRLFDSEYAATQDLHCIFRDNETRSCIIHKFKPFGCNLLICGKMTKARPITLNKTYYYHKWLDSQGIIFSIFPGLGAEHEKLLAAVSNLSEDEEKRAEKLDRGNEIIGIDMGNLMNGIPTIGKPFYPNTR